MENRLKDISMTIIDQLQAANIRTVMVTGDNALTAISVGRQCHIVHPEQRMFLGDLSETKVNGKYIINWKDFDFSDNTLDIDTLEPSANLILDRESAKKSEIQREEEEKAIEENFIKSVTSDRGFPGSLKGTSMKGASMKGASLKMASSKKIL